MLYSRLQLVDVCIAVDRQSRWQAELLQEHLQSRTALFSRWQRCGLQVQSGWLHTVQHPAHSCAHEAQSVPLVLPQAAGRSGTPPNEQPDNVRQAWRPTGMLLPFHGAAVCWQLLFVQPLQQRNARQRGSGVVS